MFLNLFECNVLRAMVDQLVPSTHDPLLFITLQSLKNERKKQKKKQIQPGSPYRAALGLNYSSPYLNRAFSARPKKACYPVRPGLSESGRPF